MTAPEATAATTVTAESPASFAAATVAVLEAALAAASMAPPSGASTTLNLFTIFLFEPKSRTRLETLWCKNQEIPSARISHIWAPLKGPKREIFDFGVFAQIRPIWIGDLGSRPKNLNFDGLGLKIANWYLLALSPSTQKNCKRCRLLR